LIGEHDFSAFRAASCQSNSPHRRVDEITFLRRGSFVVMQVTANAFLHHMVRNLAGSIGMVGRHLKPEAWIEELLEGRNRTLAADTAPPDGLYLVDVGYPADYNLPNQTKGPIFLCLD
jgi:tRNA pseudouridine38-40 synthase